MNLTVDLQVATEEQDHPPPSLFNLWVLTALNHVNNNQTMTAAELSIRLVDQAESTELNHSYRGKNQATNVLSFPADIPDFIDLPLLGDLVICSSVVQQEAIEQHKLVEAHWAHMVVHGTLHLLGYDHIDDDEAEEMEALEIAILASLDIANPYDDVAPSNTTTL